jgi:ATP-binding cassette subfamily B protein
LKLSSNHISKPLYSLWPIVWRYLRPYRWRVICFLIALLVTSAATLLVGQGLKMVIDQGLINQSKSYLGDSIIFLFVIALILAVATYTRFYMISWLGERFSADMRQAVFEHVVRLHPGFFESYPSGNIMSRITTDTTLLQSIIGGSLSLALRSCVTFFGALIMLIATDLYLAMVVLVGVPLAVLPVVALGRKVRSLSNKSQDSVADVGSYAGEIIQQIKTVQSYTCEAQECRAFSTSVERAFDIARRRIRNRASLTAVVILTLFVALSVLLWVGGNSVVTGSMSGGDLGAFVFYALLMAMTVATLSEVYGQLQQAAGATERLTELLEAKNLIFSKGMPIIPNIDSKSKSIKFENVTFAYNSNPTRAVVSDFSVTIEPGEVVAVVGSSGAGKSTLFDLMQRFYDPQSGRILVDGIDIVNYEPIVLRGHIGLVQQQPVLFNGSIRHNITYGSPDASDAEIIQAAKAAQAHDFIMQLRDDYDSTVGERGARLSGGQCQRIAIARVLLKDPNILLLDEATSALDSDSERGVQLALDTLMSGRTTVIIAHRLATVKHANRIILVEKGQILSIGRHEALLRQSALYRRLASLQLIDHD